MKILTIGDVHGRAFWKNVIDYVKPDKVIFIGDYLDSFDIHPNEIYKNFLDIISLKKSNVDDVILLLGNHDFHYSDKLNRYDSKYSGFNHNYKFKYSFILEENHNLFQLGYQYKNYIWSHAGILNGWLMYVDSYLDRFDMCDIPLMDKLDIIYNNKSELLDMVSKYSGGTSKSSSLLWTRPEEFSSGMWFGDEYTYHIVGHTHLSEITKYKFDNYEVINTDCLLDEYSNLNVEELLKYFLILEI